MSYQPRPMNAPRLTGGALRLVVRLAESAGIGSLLRKKLLKDVGVDELRNSPAEEAPCFLPLLPVPGDAAAPLPAVIEELGDKLSNTLPSRSASAFRFPSVADYVQAYRNGEITPSQVAQKVLEAVEQSETGAPPLRLFIAQRREEVLQQASESTQRWQNGQPIGPLDGVPVAVKDEVDQAGYPTTVGTGFLGDQPKSRDATVVARLRSAGALLLGKTNMHEIGLGVTGLNTHHGSARNPYNPQHCTGGSSSGSAAAVAYGICPIAVGADGGGSIRVPAGLCGVVGLKPTYGRVSEDAAAPLCWSVAHVGPIAATAQDAALGYLLMAGPDFADPHTLRQPTVDLDAYFTPDLQGRVFGVFRPWFEHADREIVETLETILRRFTEAGARIEEIDIPDVDLFRRAHMVTIVSEMRASQKQWLTDPRRYGLDVRMNVALAKGLTADDYVHAQRLRRRAIDTMLAIHQNVDGIITPTTACTAPQLQPDALKVGESNLPVLDKIMRFATLANFTGLPGISFPAGYDALGLPIGCQVMAGPWQEAFLLQCAQVAETFVERRPPQAFADILNISQIGALSDVA